MSRRGAPTRTRALLDRGALVAFSGHDTGLGEDLSTRTAATAATGSPGVPRAPGTTCPWRRRRLRPLAARRRSRSPPARLGRQLHDEAELGARVRQAGVWFLHRAGFQRLRVRPASAIDGTSRSVWSTRSPPTQPVQGARNGVQLPQPITLGEVRIDPTSDAATRSSAAVSRLRGPGLPERELPRRPLVQGAFTGRERRPPEHRGARSLPAACAT